MDFVFVILYFRTIVLVIATVTQDVIVWLTNNNKDE